MSNEDRDVDAIVGAAGKAWRARQPAPPEPDLARLLNEGRSTVSRQRAIRQASLRGRWAPAAAIGAVLAVLAIVAVPNLLGRGRSGVGPAKGTAPGATYATLPADHGSGVRVVGIGNLFRDGTSPIRLCTGVAATLDMPSSHAECGRVAVATTGVDPAWLVNVTTGGQAYSQRVRVEGLYRNGTLAVSRAVESPLDIPPPADEPTVPCPAPARGWQPGTGFPSSVDEFEPARRLDQYLRQHADRYTQLWEGHPDKIAPGASSPTRSVEVVGTTGDLAQARTDLTKLYSGNLCVYPVPHSSADLEQIARTLVTAGSTPIEAVPLTIENKVRVTVVALDEPTVELLRRTGEESLQIEAPLLQGLS